MYVHILTAVVARLPVIDGGGDSRLCRGLGYGAAEGERYGLVGVEVLHSFGQVALKARVCRVAVSVGQRGCEGLPLRSDCLRYSLSCPPHRP